MDEKVESVRMALKQINVAEAARQVDIPASTLRYDLNKIDQALPAILANQPPGPKPPSPVADGIEQLAQAEKPGPCPKCGGQVRKNGTYWVLNWVLMLTMGWLGVQQELLQRWRCKGCGHELVSPERTRQAEARQAWWQQVNRLIALMAFHLCRVPSMKFNNLAIAENYLKTRGLIEQDSLPST